MTTKPYDLDKARDPIQLAEWSRANLRMALRDVRIALKELMKSLDASERAESRAAEPDDE